MGKLKNGHDVINDGVVSPEFSISDPYFNHKTFDVGYEDTDYFYLTSE